LWHLHCCLGMPLCPRSLRATVSQH
jgi:hypothetical protein